MSVTKYITRFLEQTNLNKKYNTILIAYLRRGLKYNLKQKHIYYREEFDNLNTLIKVVIKLNNKLHKLAI